jgi:putative tricarboxylic transport membrane protein
LNRGDIVSGVVLAALGGFIVSEAAHWEYLGPDGPGPGFFPLWYGIAIIALALALMVTTVMQRARERDSEINWQEVKRAMGAWAALAVCVALLKVLGFLLAFGLFVFFLVAVMYRRPLGAALAISVAMAAGFYLLFPVALNVALPVGKLGF